VFSEKSIKKLKPIERIYKNLCLIMHVSWVNLARILSENKYHVNNSVNCKIDEISKFSISLLSKSAYTTKKTKPATIPTLIKFINSTILKMNRIIGNSLKLPVFVNFLIAINYNFPAGRKQNSRGFPAYILM
jgi:hypothetical protein